jgi:hypothetical protein
MTETKVNKRHLNPAEYVILIFGGVRPLARRLDIDPSTISYWRTRKPRGGLNVGEIPRWHWIKIIQIAQEEKKPITEKDLLRGRDIAA